MLCGDVWMCGAGVEYDLVWLPGDGGSRAFVMWRDVMWW